MKIEVIVTAKELAKLETLIQNNSEIAVIQQCEVVSRRNNNEDLEGYLLDFDVIIQIDDQYIKGKGLLMNIYRCLGLFTETLSKNKRRY